KSESPRFILKPSLTEHDKHFVSRPENPSHSALPAHVLRFVVELNEVEECQVRTHRVICSNSKDSCDEVSFFEVRKCLVPACAHKHVWRNLVLERSRKLIRISGPVAAKPPGVVKFPGPL